MNKLDVLWDYQQADLDYDRLENKLKNSSARVNLLKIRKYLVDQQDLLVNMEAKAVERRERVDQMRTEYEAQLERYKQLEGELSDRPTETLEDVEALLSDYMSTQERIVALRKELYTIIQELKKTSDKLSDMRVKIQKARKDFAKYKELHSKELEDAAPELKRLQDIVLDKEKGVDQTLLKRYKTIKKNKSAPLALVEAEQCGGCNMSLPQLVVSHVREGGDIVECENCGRILYVPEG